MPSSTARLFDEAREGERVVSIMEAIVTDRPLLELAVNVRNDGLIPNLPAEAVVEVPGLVDGRGVHGVAGRRAAGGDRRHPRRPRPAAGADGRRGAER